MGLPPYPNCGQDAATFETGPPAIDGMPLEIHTQPDPDHFCETCGGPSELVSPTITPWDGNETMAREVSPWTPRCADPWCQSRRSRHSKMSDARLRALRRSVGTADEVPGHGSVSVACQLCCKSRRGWPGAAHQPHTAGCLQLHSQTTGATTIETDAHNKGREERRALLEQRRAAVVRQLRRLTIELTDIDRQLDEIEQSER